MLLKKAVRLFKLCLIKAILQVKEANRPLIRAEEAPNSPKMKPHILPEFKTLTIKLRWRKSASVGLVFLKDHRSRVFPAVLCCIELPRGLLWVSYTVSHVRHFSGCLACYHSNKSNLCLKVITVCLFLTVDCNQPNVLYFYSVCTILH